MPLPPFWRFALLAGTVAATASGWVMVGRGRRDAGRAAAAVNAPSHWVWGDEAIRRDGVDLRHTGLGTVVHWASSVLWGSVFAALRAARRRPTAANAMADAAAVTAVAACVDLRVVPHRFTPGFERRLTGGSLCAVYAAFAAGLAIAERAKHRARGRQAGAPTLQPHGRETGMPRRAARRATSPVPTPPEGAMHG
jgi:hypothetical protein